MELLKFFLSKKFNWVLISLGSVIILLAVFQLGVSIGFHKARFSYRWANNYHRMFGGPKGGFMDDYRGREFTSGHGVAGSIVRVENSSLVIKGSDNIEKVVLVTTDTIIRKGWNNIQLADLKSDDQVVVIGSPKDDGSINAKIIRVFDNSMMQPPPSSPFDFLRH